MKNWLNKYFGFTKREYNGLLVLMAILLSLSIAPYFYAGYLIQAKAIDPTEAAAIQKLVLMSKNQRSDSRNFRPDDEDSHADVENKLFRFDPNKIDLMAWQRLGLSLKQAQAILNYRSKGGRFYKKEDLKKMYTITAQKYQQLEPYMEIENTNIRYPNPERKIFIKSEPVIIDINTADTLQLDLIKGIGLAFAKRIVKYRERLGGFYKKEQLREVYGIDSVKYEEIAPQIKVDVAQIKRININTAEFGDMKNHPYLRFKQINAIIQYRKQHGKFSSIDDLKKVAILDQQSLQALIPYLIFSND